jgi:hypothetical protein
LIEQDNQSSAFAKWLTESLLSPKKNLSIVVLRIESKYNGLLSVPEEGTVSTDGGELQMIKRDTKSLPFFCVLQGPTDDLISFCEQLTSGLDKKNVEYAQTNILAHGGITPVDIGRVKAGQVLPMKTAGLVPIANSNDAIYLAEGDPVLMFPNIGEGAARPAFSYTLESGRKEACVSFYVALPDVQLPEGGLLKYAMETDSDEARAGADVVISVPANSMVVQKGFNARSDSKPPKPEFRWENLNSNILGQHVKLAKVYLATEDIPRYDPEGLANHSKERIENELGGTMAYVVETTSGVLQIKLTLRDLDGLKKASGTQQGAKMLWLRIPVLAKNVRTSMDENIFDDTYFGSFYGILQGRYGNAELKQKWESFWQTELVSLTICIQL